MQMTETATPKLLKSRIRHTRLLLLLLLPLLPFAIGYITEESPLHEVLEWIGYLLVIISVLGRGYCSLYIGGRKNDVLMRQGPYSAVRNPLYFFSFSGVLGIALQSGLITFMVLLPLAFILYYPVVIRREEAFLLHKFGDEYRNYMHSVPRYIPNLSLWCEPEVFETKPAAVRQTFMDAALFFLPLPIFELIEQLHVAGLLPVYLMVP